MFKNVLVVFLMISSSVSFASERSDKEKMYKAQSLIFSASLANDGRALITNRTQILQILNDSKYVCEFALSDVSSFKNAAAMGMQIGGVLIYQPTPGVRSVNVSFEDPKGAIESQSIGVHCDLNRPVAPR